MIHSFGGAALHWSSPRDIKPANVLLSSHSPPLVRLADFGLAQRRSEGLDLTMGQSALQKTAHFKGTSIYAAPEMLQVYLDDSDSDEEGKGLGR